MKYFLIALLIVWWFFSPTLRRKRRLKRERQQQQAHAKAQAQAKTKSNDTDSRAAQPSQSPQTMIACAHCGVHLPENDAVHDHVQRAYCSDQHRQLGQTSL